MSKSAVRRWLLAGLVAFATGLGLAQASIAFGQASGIYVSVAEAVVGLRVAPHGLIVVALASASALSLLAGVLTLVIAWAAVLANVRLAARRAWFWFLLILGIPTVGVGPLVAYLIAGPDRAPSTA